MSITTNPCCDETEPRSIHSPDICMDMGVCMAESETITTLLISYTPVQNKKVKKERKEGSGIQRCPTQTMTMTISNSKTPNKQTTKLQNSEARYWIQSCSISLVVLSEKNAVGRTTGKTAWFLALLWSVGYNPQRFKIPFLRVLWLPEEYITVNVFILTLFLVIPISVKCCLWPDSYCFSLFFPQTLTRARNAHLFCRWVH